MRRTTAAASTSSTFDELSGRVLAIIGAYRMGAVVEARNLCQKPVPEAPPPTPRPAEGYIRNGIYHVADTDAPRRA